MIKRIPILILFISICFSLHSQNKFEGQVLDKLKRTPISNSRLFLYQFERDSFITMDSSESHPIKTFYKDSIYRSMYKGYSDSNGYFQFNNLTPGVYKLTAAAIPIKTEKGVLYEEYNELIFTVQDCDSRISENIYLSVFCPFDSTKNLTTCPECNKKDMIREFRYGLPTIPLEEDKYIYTGDCSPPRCRPARFCLRCKLEF